jgi:hypothetical protein
MSATVLLAASDTGKGSPIGLFVVLLLLIAVYLLYRSMTGHLRRLPEKFPGYEAGGTDEAAGPAATGADARGGAGTGPGGPVGPDAERVRLTKRRRPPADR